ncbi:MAG: cell division protein ZapE [Rickettsiales bacterium]|nr:cell division protein ZapE [Rickettsiales bacterium]
MSGSGQIKDIIASTKTPVDAYASLLASKTIGFDLAQKRMVDALQVLFDYICSDTFRVRGQGFFARFRSKDKIPARCGTYLWGGVGRGKTMLMDMFFELAPIPNKHRVHFHAFMRDVHERIHMIRKNEPEAELIPLVVDQLAEEFHLLCLDEFQVLDVTDAMILSKLFTCLFQKGVVVVITSNREPDELYKNGIQRDQFLPFIELVKGHMDVTEIKGGTDYRLEQIKSMDQVYFTPLGPKADEFLIKSFQSLTRGQQVKPVTIEILGRKIDIKTAAGGVGWFSFASLCEQPLGASDYMEIASTFHTIIIKGIPKLSPEKRNEAKRFVTLIDTLYEHKTNVICSAEVGEEDLYPKGDGSFEFERTVSRLKEMQSEGYLEASHIRSNG